MAKVDQLLIVAAFGATAASLVTVGSIVFATLGVGLVRLLVFSSICSADFRIAERVEIGSCV